MKKDHLEVLLEDIDHQLKTVLEGQAAMATVPKDIATLKDDMAEVKDDLQAIKAAVTDQTHQLTNHEVRITSLEEAA